MYFDGFPREGGWYFIGIGGVSMSALALLLQRKGFRVRGSDSHESVFTEKLSKTVPVYIGDDQAIEEQNVVFTGAIGPDHPQLAAAKRAGKRLYSRAELLGKIAAEYPLVISVAGCHGKTSTTAMLAHIFRESNRAFTCHIGGEDAEFSNFFSSGDDFFITEACEFRRSFLSLKSSVAVVLNTDRDHTDCYKSDAEVLEAYAAFLGLANHAVVNAEDRIGMFPHTRSFGFSVGDVCAVRLRSERERYSFTVRESGIPAVRIRLNVVGKFQVQNALAAYCAARICGCSPKEIARGLESFHGVGRRFERAGTLFGAPLYCDYAHHPREISAVIGSAKKLTKGKLRIVFQPHTYTRTRDFMREFCHVLNGLETPIIYDTFSAREPYLAEGSAELLARNIDGAVFARSPAELEERLRNVVTKDDLVLVLGAGDIDGIARKMCTGGNQ